MGCHVHFLAHVDSYCDMSQGGASCTMVMACLYDTVTNITLFLSHPDCVIRREHGVEHFQTAGCPESQSLM